MTHSDIENTLTKKEKVALSFCCTREEGKQCYVRMKIIQIFFLTLHLLFDLFTNGLTELWLQTDGSKKKKTEKKTTTSIISLSPSFFEYHKKYLYPAYDISVCLHHRHSET